MEQYDVVVVGGGVAGSALGAELAQSGIRVLVLERQTSYRDKVRGEYMQPWGVAEMLRLGLEQTVLDAGGGYTTEMVGYGEHLDPAVAEASAIPLGMLLTDVQGGMCVGHPQLCEALNTLAVERGAVVVRGVGDVEVEAGTSPVVRYEFDGIVYDVSCRLVIGADGRQSTVRKVLGIPLEQVQSKATLGGMLVRAEGWHEGRSIVGVEGDVHFLAFPRPNGYVRLYTACEPGPSTAGPDRAQHLLDSFRLECVPHSERLSNAEPAGPCSFFQGTDSWTERPMIDGAVLVGDAAGWSDPILGEGLSVAMRDARTVAEVLTGGDEWTADAFQPYAEERAERMRRLRVIAYLMTELRCTFTPAGRARRVAVGEQAMSDPLILGLMISSLAGPETGPAEAFEQPNVTRILALA